MSDKENREKDPSELAERDLDALQGGGAQRRSSHLASGVEERKRDQTKGATNGSPVFDLPEDFAP